MAITGIFIMIKPILVIQVLPIILPTVIILVYYISIFRTLYYVMHAAEADDFEMYGGHTARNVGSEHVPDEPIIHSTSIENDMTSGNRHDHC